MLLLQLRRRQQMILRMLLILLLPTHQYHKRNNPTLRPARAAPRADAGDKRTITVLRVSAALLLPPPGSCSTCTCARHSKYNKYTILVTHMSTRGVTKTGHTPATAAPRRKRALELARIKVRLLHVTRAQVVPQLQQPAVTSVAHVEVLQVLQLLAARTRTHERATNTGTHIA